MPLFLFISGLFSKKMIDQKNYEKIFGFLFLFFFLKVLGFLFSAIFYGNYSFNLFNDGGLPWFMFVLFVYGILTIMVKNISPAYLMIPWIIFALIIGYDSKIADFLCLSRIVVFFPFYYMGYLLDPKWIETYSQDNKRKLLALFFISSFVILVLIGGDKIYFLRYFFSGRNPYSETGIPLMYGGIIRLCCYFIQFIMCASIVILAPDRLRINKISQLGQYTLSVYMFHYIILEILYNKLHIRDYYSLICPSHPNWLILPLALILTVLLSNKCLMKPLNFISQIPTHKK